MFPLISRLQALEKKDVVILQVHFFVWKNVQLFEAQKLLDAKTRWPSSLSNFFGLEDVPKVEGGPGLMGPLGPLGFIGWYFVTHWKGIFCGKLTHGFPIFLFTHLEIQS